MGAVCDRCGAKKIVHICDLCGVIEFQRECARLAARNANLLAALRAILGAILEGPGALPGTVPEWHQWEPIIQARAAIERNS